MRIGITKMSGTKLIKQKLGRRGASDLEDAFEIDTSIKIFFKDGTYLKRDHDDKTEFWTLERP